MTYYNLSFMSNSTGIAPLWVGVNEQSNGVFIYMLLFMIFLLLLMVFMSAGYTIKETLLGASFILSIVGGLFWGVGLFPDWGLGIILGMLVISLMAKMIGDG